MLRIKILHPGILKALASNGHGAQIVIADANFPFETQTLPTSQKVYLNLSPGILTVTQVLTILKDYIAIESAIAMSPPDDSVQPIHREFRDILGEAIPFSREKRASFYGRTRSEDICLVIATGETRRYANVVLVMGTVLDGPAFDPGLK